MNMDFPTGRSSARRELQGPKPTPLRIINKDSHKIKKPPLPPPPQPPPRQPIIIYTVSPKIIHTTPADFMTLVQRLTGSSSSSDVGPNNNPLCTVCDTATEMVSPAARYATVEKARSPIGKKLQNNINPMMRGDIIIGEAEGVNMKTMMMGNNHGIMERTNNSMFQGILSPEPASLCPIPSSLFSPPSSDPASMMSFLHDLSPAFHSNNGIGSSFIMTSPSNFVSPQSFDLFSIFLD